MNKNVFLFGKSYKIPDSTRSDIKLRHFPVLSAFETFHLGSFGLVLLHLHYFKCYLAHEIVKFGVALVVIRYRVTGALIAFAWDQLQILASLAI